MDNNYTHLDRGRFDAQRRELESLLGDPTLAGRVYYLRFDLQPSWGFLMQQAYLWMTCWDFPMRLRTGPVSLAHLARMTRTAAIRCLYIETPMVAMEATLAAKGPEHAV